MIVNGVCRMKKVCFCFCFLSTFTFAMQQGQQLASTSGQRETSQLQTLVENTLWMTEDYPPFHYIENERIQGKVIDVMNLVFKRNDIRFEADQQVLVFPWARAFSELTNNPKAAIITMAYTQEREKYFLLSSPILSERIAIIVDSKRDIQLNGLEELSEFVIGVVREDIGESLLKSKVQGDLNLTMVLSSNELIQMLLKGRVDMIAYSADIIDFQLSKLQLSGNQVRVLHVLAELPTSIAFNREVDKKLFTMFNRTIIELKNDGTLKGILNSSVSQGQQ